jgi:hypothetical protein
LSLFARVARARSRAPIPSEPSRALSASPRVRSRVHRASRRARTVVVAIAARALTLARIAIVPPRARVQRDRARARTRLDDPCASARRRSRVLARVCAAPIVDAIARASSNVHVVEVVVARRAFAFSARSSP